MSFSQAFPAEEVALGIVHDCNIFRCSLDVGNIDDQCRGPSMMETDHLAGSLSFTLVGPTGDLS